MALAAFTSSSARAADDAARKLDDHIAHLITQLGNDDYFLRERAQQELSQIGFEAFDSLEAAADDPDIEVSTRAKYLVSQMQVEWIAESDAPEVKRLLQNYGNKDDAAHLTVITQLIELPNDKGLPVLCRLVRFDKSLQLSKRAALAIISQKGIGEDRWPQREQILRDNLGRSPRAGAEWLRAYVLAHNNPTAGAIAWGQLAESEQRAMPVQPQMACALWRQQVATLKKLDRRDEAVAAMMRVVDLEDGHSETLIELVDWLVEQEAWSVVDAVATRFAQRIEREPILLYTLAQAQKAQGNAALAEATAAKALALNNGTAFENLVQHYQAARELQRRGMLPWCLAEYRHVIGTGTAGEFITLYAQRGMSELLHDHGDDRGAAETWQQAVDGREAKEKSKEADSQDLLARFGPMETMKARLHFFKACQSLAEGNREAQVRELKAGLDLDPTEVDVLIALFRVPDLDTELREKTRRLIRESAEGFRREIQGAPDDPTAYNQLAWLIANTEGDKLEARQSSERSLELVRNQSEDKEVRQSEAGYLDTLAHCHFALGELQQAVDVQSKAVSLDPHSGQMSKQLGVFKAALAAAQNKTP